MTAMLAPPSPKATAAVNFREDATPGLSAGPIAVAPAKTRITPRETLTFQLRNTTENVILDIATPLLGLAVRLREMERCDDIESLHRRVENDIQAFETELMNRKYDKATVIAARYCLCSFVDEAVMSTPWGAESFWPEQTMLSKFHNESWGGEKFFGVLERVLDQSGRFQELLEFLYVCVGMGFEGKFHVMHNGRNMLDRLLDTVYQVLTKHRGEAPETLTAPEENVAHNRKTLRRVTPLWLISAIGCLTLAALYVGFRVSLDQKIDAFAAQISAIL